MLVVTGLLLGAGCASFRGNADLESSTSTSMTTQASVDTATWKLYTSIPCGVSLKHPSDAVFSFEDETGFTITTQEDYDFQQNQEGEAPSAYYIGVSCKDLQTLVAENGMHFTGDAKSITSLDAFFSANTSTTINRTGTATVGDNAASVVSQGTSQSYSLWVSRGKVYIFDFSYTAKTVDDLTPTQKAILESVTFME